MEEVQLTSEKSFKIELSSDKNNTYSLEFNLKNYIEITANQINNIIHKSYSNKYSFEEIRETKYFLQFDTFSEIFDEIKNRIDNNKIIIKENDNSLTLNALLPENEEIIFELNPIIKNNDDRLNELTDIIMKLNSEMNNIKSEIKQLNNENLKLKNEIIKRDKLAKVMDGNTQLKNDLNNLSIEMEKLKLLHNNLEIEYNQLKNANSKMKNNNNLLKNDIILLKKEIKESKDENIDKIIGVDRLKKDITQSKNDFKKLKNENTQLKKELNQLRNDNTQLKSDNNQISNQFKDIIKEIDTIKNENKALINENNNLKDKINEINIIRDDNTKLNDEIDILKVNNDKLNDEIDILKVNNIKLNDEINNFKTENNKIKTKIEENNKEINILKENQEQLTLKLKKFEKDMLRIEKEDKVNKEIKEIKKLNQPQNNFYFNIKNNNNNNFRNNIRRAETPVSLNKMNMKMNMNMNNNKQINDVKPNIDFSTEKKRDQNKNKMNSNNINNKFNNIFQNNQNINKNLSGKNSFQNNAQMKPIRNMKIALFPDNKFGNNNIPDINNNFNNAQLNKFNSSQNRFFNNQTNPDIKPMKINKQKVMKSHSFEHLSLHKDIKFNLPHANGLQNIGATCYMNATLQCFAHVENFTKYLLKNKEDIKLKKYGKKLSNAFVEVLENIWENKNINYYAPNNFKNLIIEMNPLFAGIQANDSKDLVIFILEIMHNELNAVKNANQKNFEFVDQSNYDMSLMNFIEYFKDNFKSVVSDIFYGAYNLTMQCHNCKNINHNIQCFNILIMPLEEVRKFKNSNQNCVTIRECFEYYQRSVYMTGENKIYCNICKKMLTSKENTTLLVGPKVLILNLNRGKDLQYNVSISFDEYLNISDFIFYKNTNVKYRLIGVVTRFGPSGENGHFIAFCKSFVDRKWYKYNDALVTSSSFNDAKNTGVPYILFYAAQ